MIQKFKKIIKQQDVFVKHRCYQWQQLKSRLSLDAVKASPYKAKISMTLLHPQGGGGGGGMWCIRSVNNPRLYVNLQLGDYINI